MVKTTSQSQSPSLHNYSASFAEMTNFKRPHTIQVRVILAAAAFLCVRIHNPPIFWLAAMALHRQKWARLVRSEPVLLADLEVV